LSDHHAKVLLIGLLGGIMSKMKDIHISAQEIARSYGLPVSETIVNAIACAWIEGYSTRWNQEVAVSEANARMMP
jgi:post-segregation antitoxin (ccd killing protein)